MCGIIGIFSQHYSKDVLFNQITSMTASLDHRGPDGWGRFLTKNIALGHTRLSIVDLNSGDQPMMTERYVITFNGEIYNHIELRKTLEEKGALFKTNNSDTEVILKAFEVYGESCLKMLNGQFAFLLWDRKEKKLITARDRYGIRPLYILKYAETYYFASEMKAFDLIPGYTRTFNIQNLFEHALLWNTLNNETAFHNIESVPGGGYYIFEQGKDVLKKYYYTLGETFEPYTRNYEAASGEFYNLLFDSVKLRLRSDVPVGAYLSGGVDSSVIAELVSKNNNNTFKTFSIVFSDNEYDERNFQQQMINNLNCNHGKINISYDTVNTHFIDAVYHFERPVFRTAPLPLYLLSEKVNNSDIKVVLTGEGADEVLFGYDSFKELKLLEFWSRQSGSKIRPLLIKRLYPHLKHYSDPQQYGMMKMYYEDFLDQYDNVLSSVNIRIHNNKVMKNYLNKDFQVKFDKNKLIEKFSKSLPNNYQMWSTLQKNQYIEMKTLLSGYLLSSQGDRMSMSHSVEGRYPFLDHRLVETLFSYPDIFKLKGFSQKHILRDTFKDVIPDSIINRPKLPYQAPDLKSFIRNGQLTEQAAYFLSDNLLNDYGIFNTKFVNRFINKFKTRKIEQFGYRDNMLITFILSGQITQYWINKPKNNQLDESKKTVDIIED